MWVWRVKPAPGHKSLPFYHNKHKRTKRTFIRRAGIIAPNGVKIRSGRDNRVRIDMLGPSKLARKGAVGELWLYTQYMPCILTDKTCQALQLDIFFRQTPNSLYDPCEAVL